MFFITGLPRSRTKWFADYFSGLNDTVCWHEAMNGCHSTNDFLWKMTRLPFTHIGNSDSGLMYTNFQQWFMGAPTVVIERDFEDVLESLEHMFGEDFCTEGDMRKVLTTQAEKLKSVQGKRIPFDEINDRIQEIHEYLVSVPFDDEYAQEMINQNLQVNSLTVDLASYQMWMGGN